MLSIPAPITPYGARVEVLNYRRRPAVWQEGDVVGLDYSARWSADFSWSYDVAVTALNGARLRLSVGDDGIRPVAR